MDLNTSNDVDISHLVGKYLTFAIGEQQYAFDILGVQEIIGATMVTSVPRSPDYFKGMINLRGRVIPVIDIRLKLGLEERPHDERTCFVIVSSDIEGDVVSIGVIVDTVLEVIQLDGAQLQCTPEFGYQIDATYVKGIGRVEEDIVILLEVQNILKRTDLKGETEPTSQISDS